MAVTGDYRFLSIPNIDEPRSVLLAALPEEQLPYDGSPLKAWDVVPAAMSLGRGVEVLVAVRNTLFSVDGREARDLVG